MSFLLTFVYKNVTIELTNINKLMNKYTKWYNNITENAKNRILSDYTESHHIQPRSLGGSDDVTNLVDLTPREHFICHWLLVKMTSGKDHHRMLNALRMMRAENQNQERYKTKITARVYESIKKEYSKLQSTQFRGKGNGFYGKTHSDEARRRISEANTGRKPPQHEIDKLKQSLLKRKEQGIKRAEYSEEYKLERSKMYTSEGNPRYGVEVSEETRKRIGDKLRGRKQTEEEKLVRSLANMGKKREKKLCPHCDQHVAVNGYARWHGDNCKKL